MSLEPNFLSKSDCIYTPCFCEENVWNICDYLRRKFSALFHKCVVVFISNENNSVPIWKQKANHSGLVIWDYHVLVVILFGNEYYVYDLDSLLDFPSTLKEYFEKAIGSEKSIKADYRRKFRVISAKCYLEHFASDRTHMLKEDGTYFSPPPKYPCISTPHSKNNLDIYRSMKNDSDCDHFGSVYCFSDFLTHFLPDVQLANLPDLCVKDN
ncbi:unnamed protein product [Dimorphilus gyrociliatus]|uniref:Protein N-terminal glutamine amidohydrolase n=1 Tax=Dimorphilus gyrociliatus TaxID=2664684 RepID=A0A7I8VKU1_9ANNE|nr:unnamed protein product [Dimorphilus gyrociliatus]